MPPDNLTVKRPGPAYTPPKSDAQREADRIAKEKEMIAQGRQWPINAGSGLTITPDAANSALQAQQLTAQSPQAMAMPEQEQAPRAADKPNKETRPHAERAPAQDEDDKPRKKRTRTRKRKPSSEAGEITSRSDSRPARTEPAAPREQKSTPADPTLLKLR
jgi:hypothetical protein